MQNAVALITGIGGQDGAYLAALLLAKGYTVYGTSRSLARFNGWRLDALGIRAHVQLVEMDLTNEASIRTVVARIKPNELYNLAAQSFIAASFERPVQTMEVDGIGPLRILDAIRTLSPTTRFFQASTSEIFGATAGMPQNEATVPAPQNPYGVAKLAAHLMTGRYRDAYGLYACAGILFNHESPLRGREFVTRKITSELALIRAGRQRPLLVGNMNAERDWGFAGDTVDGIWRMLQQGTPSDFVFATGEARSVRTFIATAAPHYGFDILFTGEGLNEKGFDRKTGQLVVEVSTDYYRPREIPARHGDATRAQTELGWTRRLDFAALVKMMAEADMTRVAAGELKEVVNG